MNDSLSANQSDFTRRLELAGQELQAKGEQVVELQEQVGQAVAGGGRQ